MSAGSGPAQRRAERRRLLEAFVLCVDDEGYRDLDPAAVARRAGLAPEAFGRHFPDSRACFLVVWDQLEERYLERLASAGRGHRDWRDLLRASIAATLRAIEASPAAARLMTIETFGAGEPERARQRLLGERLTEMLAQALEPLDLDAPERTPHLIMAMLFDRIYRHLLRGEESSLSARLPEIMYLALLPLVGAEQAKAEFELSER